MNSPVGSGCGTPRTEAVVGSEAGNSLTRESFALFAAVGSFCFAVLSLEDPVFEDLGIAFSVFVGSNFREDRVYILVR